MSTDNITPLQEALSRLGMMRQTENENIRMNLNANEVAMMLNSLLPKEKEFAEKCFEAGEVKGWFHEGPSIKPGPPPPDRQQFIDNLYEK